MIIALQLFFGFVFLIIGAEVLVRGASQLATALGMSKLTVGLTVVAFGTSSPEFAVSINSALTGSADLAIGNAIGSNILNTFLILGVTAIVVPVAVDRGLMRVDLPVMITATGLVWFLALDNRLSRLEGVVLAAGLVGYLWWQIATTRRQRAVLAKAAAQQQAEARQADPGYEPPKNRTGPAALINLVLVVLGLVILTWGCQLFVDGSVAMAERLGVSKLIIGLTIVSVGTSLPELVTCLVAAWRGHQEIVVGNVIGSNLFNFLGVLGLTSIVAREGYLEVSPTALGFDFPVVMFSALICIPLFVTGWAITRLKGSVLLILYLSYLAVLLVKATGSV